MNKAGIGNRLLPELCFGQVFTLAESENFVHKVLVIFVCHAPIDRAGTTTPQQKIGQV
jgi:hypothetical protein